MAAQLVDKLPEAQAWLYELKFDGYRALVIKDRADVRVLSRNRKDLLRARDRSQKRSPPSGPPIFTWWWWPTDYGRSSSRARSNLKSGRNLPRRAFELGDQGYHRKGL
jgi:hypothetical protein